MKKLLFAAVILLSITATAQETKHRCEAITAAKTQCTRNTKQGVKFCQQHNPSAFLCEAKTQAGGTCKRHVSKAGDHCKTHQKTVK